MFIHCSSGRSWNLGRAITVFMWWLVGEWGGIIGARSVTCVGCGCSVCGIGLVIGRLVCKEIREYVDYVYIVGGVQRFALNDVELVCVRSLCVGKEERKKEIPYKEGILKGIGSSVGITTL